MLQGLVFVSFNLIMLGLVHLYLYRRLVRDVTDRRAMRVGALAALSTGAVGAVAEVARARLLGPTALSVIPPFWFALVTYLVFALVVADLLRWLWARGSKASAAPLSEERRLFLSRAVAATSLLAGTGLASFGAFRAFAPARLTEVPLKLSRLPRALEGFTLVQLSDLHLGPVLGRRWLDELVGVANAAKPDLVAITGDLVDGSARQIGPLVEAVTHLKSRYGTYFVTGNHDYYAGASEWVALLQGWGVTALRNRRVEIGDAGASFDLLGVDDWGHFRSAARDYDLARAAEGRDPERASVLLAHQPANFDAVAQAGIDVQLSGHTHGGQMFPGTSVAQLIWGDRNAGLSKTLGSYLYVSRGCGFVGPTTRLGAPPEVVKVVLTRG